MSWHKSRWMLLIALLIVTVFGSGGDEAIAEQQIPALQMPSGRSQQPKYATTHLQYDRLAQQVKTSGDLPPAVEEKSSTQALATEPEKAQTDELLQAKMALDKATRQIQELEETNAGLEADIGVRKAETAKVRSSLAQALLQLEATQSELATQSQRAEAETRQQVEMAKEELTMAQAQKTKTQSESTDTQGQDSPTQATPGSASVVTPLASKSDACVQLQTKYEDATQHIMTLESSKATLETALADQQAELAAVQTQLTQTQQQFDTATTEQQNELAAAQAQLAQAQQQQETAATSHQTELAAVHTELTQSQQQLEATEAERTHWQTQHTEVAQALALVETKLSGLQAQVEATEQQEAQEQTRQAEADLHLQMLETQVLAHLQGVTEPSQVTALRQTDRLVMRMGSHEMFRLGIATLRPEGRELLDQLSGILQEFSDHTIQIEGHTDNVPIGVRNQALWPSNWELSTARAASVARYLETKGIDSERLRIGGFGFNRPLATNDTAEGRALNRRIELSLWPARQ